MRRSKPARRGRGPKARPKAREPQAITGSAGGSAGPRRKPAVGNAVRRKLGCLTMAVLMVLATSLLLVVLL